MKLPPAELPTHVPCPFCKVASGSWCRNGWGKAVFPVHSARLKAHQKWLEQKRRDS
jgi:hypothetical protein